MDKNWIHLCRGGKLLVIGSMLGALLSGCGGGGNTGSSPTGGPNPPATVLISGTAAAGAPVIGYVSVRDSSANAQPVRTNIPIEANGHYSVDVTGLTAPYAFLADGTVGGKRVSLYSAATSDDQGKTINITPFTDLIIRNIAATAVDTYLASPTNVANLTTAELDAKRVALTNQLAPALTAMGVSSSVDLLRATFNADSTGLDRFMDVVKVTPTSATSVTITNILDAANTLVIDTTTGTTTGSLSTANLDPTATPLDGMLATLKAFSSLFATSLPSASDPNLLSLISSTFVEDGVNRSAWLTQMTTDQTMVGMKFTNLVVDSIDTATGIAKIHFTPIDKAGNNLATGQPGGAIDWQMKLDTATGVWQFNGNQHFAWVNVRAYALKGTCNPASTSCSTITPAVANKPDYQTGLYLNIDNQGMQPIGDTVVTGPGLPAGGVTLTAQPNAAWSKITTVNNNACADYFMCNTNYWIMSDADIAQVKPNSVYTVKVYSNAATPVLLDTYNIVVPVPPAPNTSVATLSYPSLSGMVNLTGLGATTLTPSWSMPSGLQADTLWVFAWQQATGASLSVGNTSLNKPSGTSSLAITAPPGGGTWDDGNYTIYALDQYGRRVVTMYR